MIKHILFINLICNSFVFSIDCFKCISINNSYQPCEDPFHHNYTTDIYQSPCMGGIKGRDGAFPATSCVKISGVFDDNSDTIVIRACALDSGSLTTDTELVRLSHCGSFYYGKRYVRGCVQSCNDADGCNVANPKQSQLKPIILYVLLVFHLLQNITINN